MKNHAQAVYIVLLTCALCSAPALAEDWPQYRGVQQEGRSNATGVFDDSGFGLSLAWKQDLGRGYSSVLAVSDKVIATYGDGEANWLVAMDAAGGRRLWSYRTSEYYPAHTGSEGGPSSTPTIDGGTVFGVSRYGKLFALDLADGKERWSRQLEDGPRSKTPHYGWTTSPVIVGDLVILLTGGDAGHSITAFDRNSGEPRWHTGEGSVSYQTPAIRTLGGREQLVAVNDQKIMGINPPDGEILWEHEHGTYIVEAFAQPVTIGENQLLINSLQEVVAYGIDRKGEDYAVEELWRNRNLRSSYAVPVVQDDSIFGLSRNILVCLDAASGEVRWKSREPGARGLILVDGHLLILDRNGALVVVEAAGDAYRERARQAVFERYGHVSPSFAHGRIFVRNDDEIAALDVVDAARGGDDGRPDRELLGQFGKWVGKTEQADDPQAAANAYLEKQKTLPVIERDLVHFLYQGEDEAVAISGTFLEWWDPVPMHRVEGTDLFFRSMKLDPNAVWEYSFHPNFEGRTADPRNPHTIGSASELRMPGWNSPEHIIEKEEGNGRLDSFEFRSDVMDTTQRIQLWLPPGYGRGADRHGVVYIYNGAGALRVGELDHTLDHIVGSRVAPVIVVFLPWPRALEEYGGGRSPDLTRMLVDELVPHIDRNYRTIAERGSRALAGPAEGGMLALYGALKRPDIFGAAAAQGSSLQVVIADEILRTISALDKAERPKVFVQWTPNDQKFGEGGIDAVEGSRTLYDAFKKAGYDLHGGERPGSRGWSTWRAYYDDIMETFFPLAGGSAARP